MNRVMSVCCVVVALLAFAANSLLCRMALSQTDIDAGMFAGIRAVSAAVVLSLGYLCWQKRFPVQGSWLAGLYLAAYLLGFSFAYRAVDTGVGALLLFGAVQLTMMAYAFFRGARFSRLQWLAIAVAISGVAVLVRPGAQQSSGYAITLMIVAGIAWGGYTLLGKALIKPNDTSSAVAVTAGNFLRAVALVVPVVCFVLLFQGVPSQSVSSIGIVYAMLSGVLASGAGYALWYLVLPQLSVAFASMSQLTVPVIAAVMGVIFLNEPVTANLLVASLLVLGGVIAFLLLQRSR